MAAVLRVKRRCEDEPLSALVIACKRLKTDNTETEKSVTPDSLTAVVKFAGTITNQKDDFVEHLVKNLSKDELKTNFKQHPVDITTKAREKSKQSSAENRYKVLNCFRSLDTVNIEELEDKIINVIDVEDSISCAAKQNSTDEQDINYVYDLYYTPTTEDMVIDNVVSIHSFDQDLVFDTYRDNGKYSENECESEDSNAESNWRNDYPDSDHSKDSINEEDMKNAVMSMNLDDESDLSSEEDFVYAVNEDDVDRYGYKYARYKAKIKEEFDESDNDSSEHSICITEVSDNDDDDADIYAA